MTKVVSALSLVKMKIMNSGKFGFLVSSLLLASIAFAAADPATSIVGTWEGESKCVVGLPCRDEHVIYEIKKSSSTDSFQADGYKVVQGKRDFMGTLSCNYQMDQKTLSCSGRPDHDDDWEFKVDGNNMTGTLTMSSTKTLYRRVAVTKK